MRLEALALPPDDTPATVDAVLRALLPWNCLPAGRRNGRATSSSTPIVRSIARICRSLDGLPLAIELVAGKLEAHTAQELVALLDEHLGFHE